MLKFLFVLLLNYVNNFVEMKFRIIFLLLYVVSGLLKCRFFSLLIFQQSFQMYFLVHILSSWMVCAFQRILFKQNVYVTFQSAHASLFYINIVSTLFIFIHSFIEPEPKKGKEREREREKERGSSFSEQLSWHIYLIKVNEKDH